MNKKERKEKIRFGRAVRTCATRLLPAVYEGFERQGDAEYTEQIASDTVDQAVELIKELDSRDLLWDEDD